MLRGGEGVAAGSDELGCDGGGFPPARALVSVAKFARESLPLPSMKAVLQRVREASVAVDGRMVGRIDAGLLVLAGMASGDDDAILRAMAAKIVNLRIFEDEAGKMNLSLLDTGGGLLVVSQFTLFADCRKGRRPSFMGAAPPADAAVLFEHFVAILREACPRVETGVFQAMMEVRLNNWGPVTIQLDSREL